MEISSKMKEFLTRVDYLCFKYDYKIQSTKENEEYKTISIIGNEETQKLLYIDGDGINK